MPDLSLDTSFDGYVIGIDEAGRGPWAGPVTITALWLNPDFYSELPNDINDSKKVIPSRRASLASGLQMPPNLSCTISKGVDVIDQHGVVKTTLMAMADASAMLIKQMYKVGIAGPTHALIDGSLLPKNMPCASTAVIRGDSRSLSVAGASIIAKHSRDLLMCELDQSHPGYGWANNMGYGTKQHSMAIEQLGITLHHRRSFAPVRRNLAAIGGSPT